MKRNITKIFAALALLVFMAPSMMMWGQVTWTASEQGYTNAQDVTAFTVDNHVSGEFAKGTGTNAPKYYTSGTSVRMYNGNTLTLTPAANYQITKIEFTFNQNSGFTVSSGNYTDATWTGTTTSGVTFTNGSSQNRIQAITVTYSETGGPQPTTYTVTYNANVPGVSPIVDTYNEGADVTLRAANTFTNEGYTFEEWNTQADGDGDAYVAGDVIEDIQEDIEFYAMWTENAPSDDHWVLTSLADLTSTDVFVMVGNGTYAMTNNNGTTSAPATAAVTITGNEITSTVAGTIQWSVSGDATNGYTFYPYGSTSTWLYCNTSNDSGSNNNMRVGTGSRKVFELNSNNYLVTNDDKVDRYLSIYNNADWRGYINTSNGVATMSFYKKVTGGVVPPSITAENVSIEYNATSGSIAYTVNNEPNPAGTMTAAIVEGGTIANLSLGTIVNGAVPFTCDANTTGTERTATVMLTYTYNRETTTQNVTVTQAGDPNAVDNISDITGASQTHAVRGTVVGVNTKGFVLGDGTGYVYVYLNDAPEVSVGDIRRVSGTTDSHNNVIQYTNSASIETATSSNYNNTPAVQVLDATGIAAYNSNLHLSDYVQIEGLLVHSGNYYNITIEGVSSTASISYPNNAQQTLLNALDNKQVAVKGYFAGVSSGHFNVIMESVEEVIAEVETPTFSPAAGTYTEPQTVAISCATANSTIYYTLDGTEPTNSSTQYTGALTISTTTTVKAIAYVGTDNSMVATATYHFCSADDPYTVTEALAFNEYPANGIFVTGIVSTAPTSLSSGTLTYFISVDGEATNQLEVYKGKGLNEEAFTAQTDIQVGDIVTVYGNVQVYNSTIEFASGNYLVSFERPETPAQEYTLTVGALSHVNLFIFGGDESETIISTADGETTAQLFNGTEVLVSIDVEEGYIFQSLTITDADGDPVEMEVLTPNDLYSFVMPANNVTIAATTIVAPATTTYTLATSIESGKQYIIVGQANSVYYAMGNDKGNNRYAYEIALDGTTATATVASGNNVHEFTITSLATDGFYSICDAITPGYLYAASSSSNNLKTEETLDENNNGDWEISINSETGVASIVASNSSYTRNVMQFNNQSILFACYASASQHPVYLYKKVEPQTYTLDIDGYTDVTEGTNNMGYYLIASPVTVDPAEVDGMTEDDFDLYYFKQNPEIDPETGIGLEWINYKETAANGGGFNLVPGKGYLYAKKATNENPTYSFELTGMPYTGDGSIELVKDTDSQWAGWNLIGNPFGVTANFSETRDFYVMNTNGNEIIAAEDPDIAPMQGVFVIAEEDGESVTFVEAVATPGIDDKKVVLNVSRNRGDVIDRAIVRFGEGRQLPKFQLNQNNAKVYIAEGNQDYAVVRSAYEGEMPVSFKAETNGTYTISTNAENVEMTYLRLIDNLTGADVDLLATPSYTFDARTTDYASRFKLVFKAGTGIDENTTATETFAFFNGSEWTVSNQGNATLQVIDMTGRVLSNTQINGNATININETAGIYMLRLVNGDNTMIQKIVVR